MIWLKCYLSFSVISLKFSNTLKLLSNFPVPPSCNTGSHIVLYCPTKYPHRHRQSTNQLWVYSKSTDKPRKLHDTHSPVSVQGTTGAPSVVQKGDPDVHAEKTETATRSNDVTGADGPEEGTTATRNVIGTTPTATKLTTVTESSNNPKGI